MSDLTRRTLLTQTAALASGPFIHKARAADARRPNFLFLLTDDQSYGTLSLTGSPFMKTPNIDRIGREGVLFTNAFVAMSLCAPSRACNLTGRYPHSNGIIQNQIRWNQELPTLPRALQASGYRTAHIGKFHMDNDDRVQPGYDYWAAQVNQGSYVNPRKNINGTWTDLKGYDTDIITDQAIDFMRGTKPDQPFCAWMSYKACHGPFTPAPGHENDFANLKFEPPASFFIDDEGKPQRIRRRRGIGPNAAGVAPGQNPRPVPLDQWAERERNQYRSLMGVEDSVKRLFEYLENAKLADDTIVVYVGDNGFFHGEHGLHGKLEAYEEAIRVPMMARYPRMIKGGQKVDSFVVNVDLAPTILDFCATKPLGTMQGRSWRPLVTGKGKSTQWRKTFLYEQFANGADAATPMVKALKTDRYKVILNLFPKDVDELYDLKTDPQEMKNLASDKGNKDLLNKLKRQMIEAMRELEDPAIPAAEAALKS